TLVERFRLAPRPTLTWRSRGLAVAAVLLAALPAVAFAALPPLKAHKTAKFFENNTYVPVSNTELHVRAAQALDGVHLSWRQPPAEQRSRRLQHRDDRPRRHLRTHLRGFVPAQAGRVQLPGRRDGELGEQPERR